MRETTVKNWVARKEWRARRIFKEKTLLRKTVIPFSMEKLTEKEERREDKGGNGGVKERF